MDAKLEKVLERLKQQYKTYDEELNEINEKEDGMIDISVACALANSIPYLIETIQKQQELIKEANEIMAHQSRSILRLGGENKRLYAQIGIVGKEGD